LCGTKLCQVQSHLRPASPYALKHRWNYRSIENFVDWAPVLFDGLRFCPLDLIIFEACLILPCMRIYGKWPIWPEFRLKLRWYLMYLSKNHFQDRGISKGGY
jgi:hypothetical protein